jgi:hypothetical protein
VGVIWKVANVFAVATVIDPPLPLSKAFPAELVIAIVKVPHAVFVLLGLVNLEYEKVKLVSGVFDEVIIFDREIVLTEVPPLSFIDKQLEVGMVICTKEPAEKVDLWLTVKSYVTSVSPVMELVAGVLIETETEFNV